MTARTVLEPGPDHPITITGETVPARVFAGGGVIAEGAPQRVDEARYPPVYYFDRSALTGARLERSDKRTWCPYKGEATHFDLVFANGDRAESAVWSYENPVNAVAALADLIAFYPSAIDRVEAG